MKGTELAVQLECINHRPAGAAIFLKGAHRRTYQPHQLLYYPGAGNRCRNASIRRIRRSLREALRPYIENLCKASGRIDCAEASALAEKLKDENADFSRMSQNRVFENLSFRGNVIAFLKACVLYVANGCKWEPEIEEFIRWSESYDLWCKMIFFGASIAKANEVGEKSSKRGPANLLQQLPDTFTYAQAEMVRLHNDFRKEGYGDDAEKLGEPSLYRENSSEGSKCRRSRRKAGRKGVQYSVIQF